MNFIKIGDKFFLTYKGPPFGFFKIIVAIFKNDLRGLGAAGPYSRCQNIIKLGPKINSDLVSGGPRCPQFLAGLTAKLSIVGRGGGITPCPLCFIGPARILKDDPKVFNAQDWLR